jgi:hypothetical protein
MKKKKEKRKKPMTQRLLAIRNLTKTTKNQEDAEEARKLCWEEVGR